MPSLCGVCFILFLIFFPAKVTLLENGVALTPPMGWISWGYYGCADNCFRDSDKCLDEQLILSVADAFLERGYKEAGYEYIIIDDCWAEFERDWSGVLVPDMDRFPRGMKFLADYIHANGLKFGMYTNVAYQTCMLYPGSQDNFLLDAQTFAEWEVDYLKVDGCYAEESYLDTAYIDFGKAMYDTGRPMVYSCSWPYYKAFTFRASPDISNISKHCNLWRNYYDTLPQWTAVMSLIRYYIQEYPKLAPYHGPGHWNDPDMLLLGTGALTESQSRVQLAVYAMMSAPLLLSCDMKKITPYEKELLQNRDLIAIAQDPLGIMATPFPKTYSGVLYVKKHLPIKGDIYHSYSFALVNIGQKPKTIMFRPIDYNLTSSDGYTVSDVFAKKFIRNVTLTDVIKCDVPPEDVILYTLFAL